MKNIARFLLIILLLAGVVADCNAYDRNQVARLLEEQSYTELLTLVSTTPEPEQDAYLLNAAGYAAYQSNMAEKSEIFYRRSLATEPNNVQALLYLGLINKQWDKWATSILYFKTLAALKPANARYKKYIADCYSELKKDDSAFQYLHEAYITAPSDPYIANAYADALLEKKAYNTADSVTGKILDNEPGNAVLLATSIKSKYLQKKYKDVLLLADKLALSGQISYAPFYYAMVAALQLKDYKECIHSADLLIAAGHETEMVLYYEARALAGLKDYNASNALLQKCLKKAISENASTYYTEIADNMEQLKKYGYAQRNYDTALYLSGDAKILYRKALAYDVIKQNPQAQKAYKSFIKAADRNDSALVEYAKSRTKMAP